MATGFVKYSVCAALAIGAYVWVQPFMQAHYTAGQIVDEAVMSFRSLANAVSGTATDLPVTMEAQFKMARCLYNKELDYLHAKAFVERSATSAPDSLDGVAQVAAARARIVKYDLEKKLGTNSCKP